MTPGARQSSFSSCSGLLGDQLQDPETRGGRALPGEATGTAMPDGQKPVQIERRKKKKLWVIVPGDCLLGETEVLICCTKMLSPEGCCLPEACIWGTVDLTD